MAEMTNQGVPESKGATSLLSITKELKSSFLDYAMSVIVSRALPDVRDGLKPVHRRILYAMHTMGLYNERAYRKSAAVVGEVMSHFHPHGDAAIYQTMVGLVQNFAKRYPLLDGQGNWGSIDGDNAAAMRYTEVKMAKMAREMLTDIDKATVGMMPNFDETTDEPVVLPSRVPQLLVNGANGIAVGMATSIPPHNIGEVVDACIALVKNPAMTDQEIFAIIPAPDMPGGGVICGRSGVLQAYKTGHGAVTVRGVVDIEEDKHKAALIIKEIPYQVNKAELIEKIAELAKDKIIDGITNIRDESARDKMRVVVELRRGETPQVILNQLYKHTTLKKSTSMIMLALLHGRPVLFTLREMLDQFLIHRREVVRRRTKFDLAKNKAREHILQGLMIALGHIDEMVELIKKAKDAEEATAAMQKKYSLSAEQSKAILDMKLQRITGLEQDKIRTEIAELTKLIADLQAILDSPQLLDSVITTELEELKKMYGDKRRTAIEAEEGEISDMDLIANEEVVVTLTRRGYIKRVNLDTYAVQHRGGKGKRGMVDLSEADDFVEDVFVAKNHDELLFFTNKGRVYTMKVFQVPEASRVARGRAVVNILPLTEGERVVKLLCTTGFENKFLVMVTKKGTIKKTDAMAFSKVRSTGIHAINLDENDELAFCSLSSGNDSIVLATSTGQGIRFMETEVRPMGRHAGGVRGVLIRGEGEVVGLEVVAGDAELLFATSQGYGKRVKVSDFRVAHRGGLGVRTIPVSKRNGHVVGMVRVEEDSTVLLVDGTGKIIRLDPDEVRTMRRSAQGVRLIRLDENQVLASIVAFTTGDDTEDSGKRSEGSSGAASAGQDSGDVGLEEITPQEGEDVEVEPIKKPATQHPAAKKGKMKANASDSESDEIFDPEDSDDMPSYADPFEDEAEARADREAKENAEENGDIFGGGMSF